MIGIYMITNKINQKIYIGQSNDIERRWSEHKRSKDNCIIHKAIRKYGADNFELSVVKECTLSDLSELEIYYIKYYNSIFPNGYNMTMGGETNSAFGELNGNAKLTSDIVYQIRELYTTDITRSEAYRLCEKYISINTFADVWNGKTWRDIHYDVYTPENRLKHKRQKNRNHISTLSKEDVQFIRDCKNKGLLKSDVKSQYYPDLNINTFSDAWYGNTFKSIQSDVPIQQCNYSKQYKLISGCNNYNATFTEDEVVDILKKKMRGFSKKDIRKEYPSVNRHTFSDLWEGRTYKYIYEQICNDYS